MAKIISRAPISCGSSILGLASFDTAVEAITAAKFENISGIITLPINKNAIHSAGIDCPEHSEILADEGGSGHVAMMLLNEDIRTILVTIQMSLRHTINQVIYEKRL